MRLHGVCLPIERAPSAVWQHKGNVRRVEHVVVGAERSDLLVRRDGGSVSRKHGRQGERGTAWGDGRGRR